MKKKRHSKTHWASLAITILGVLEVKFSLIQHLFGDYSGVSLILISIVMSVLRQYTAQPIEPFIKPKANG